MRSFIRWMRRVVKAVLCVSLLAGLILGGLYVWISLASPSLGFLRGPLIENFNTLAPEWRLETADIRLAWPAYRLLPVVALEGVEIAERNGVRRLKTKAIHLRFHWRGLLNRHFEPDRIYIVRPELDLRGPAAASMASEPPRRIMRQTDSAIGEKQETTVIRDILTQIADRLRAARYLGHARLTDGAILIKNGTLRIPKASLDFKRSEQRTEIHLTADLNTTDATAGISADVSIPANGGPIHANVRLTGAPHRLSALFLPQAEFLSAGRFPVNGRLLFTIPETGPPACERFEIESEPGTLAADGIWQGPIAVRKIKTSGRIDTAPIRITMDEVDLHADGIDVTGTGAITDPFGAMNLLLDLRIPSLDISKAAMLWPQAVVPDVRIWIRDHFRGGWIRDGRFRISLTPEALAAETLPKDTIQAVAPFTDLDLTYYPPMASVRKISGIGEFSAHDIRIGVDGGTTYSGTEVESGNVVISDLTAFVARMEIHAETTGPADDIRQAIFDLTGAPDALLSAPKGRAATRLSFRFPLVEDLTNVFEYTAESNITDCEIADQWGNRMLQERLNITLAEGRLTLRGDQGEIINPDHFSAPIPLEKSEIDARIAESPPGLTDIGARIATGGATFFISGIVKLPMETPYVDINIRAKQLPLETVYSLWPATSASPARKWLQTHVAPMVLRNANLRLNLEPEAFRTQRFPDNAVEAHVDFQDATVSLDTPIPPLSGASGVLTLDVGGIRVLMDSGRILSSELSKGSVSMSGLGDDATELLVDAAFSGPVADLISFADTIAVTHSVPSDKITGGEARTRLRMTWPLFSGIPELSIQSEIERFEIVDLMGKTLTDGRFQLDFSPNNLTIQGKVLSGNTPLDIECRSNAPEPMTIGVETVADTAAFQDIGLPDLPFLKGKIPIQATIRFHDDQTDLHVKADASGLSIRLPRIGWVNRPSTIDLKAVLEAPETVEITGIDVHGENLAIEGNGSIQRGAATDLRIDLPKFTLDRTDLSVMVSSHADQALNVRLSGKTLDLGPFWEKQPIPPQKTGEKTSPPENVAAAAKSSVFENIEITADLETVLLAAKERLTHLRANVQTVSSNIRAAQISGDWDGEKRIEMQLMPRQKGLDLNLISDDAGRLLKSLGLSEHVSGGSLNLTARFEGPKLLDNPSDGEMVLENFTLRGMPILVSIVSMASFVGILDQLQSGGIDFSRLDMKLAHTDGVLDIRDGRMEGISLGMTTQGTWDFNTGALDLEGVVVPFNMVNTMIKVIPVLGKMLVGDGIIATNYSLEGSVDDPVVSIQPLSTLSPGFIKSLFGGIAARMVNGNADDKEAEQKRPESTRNGKASQ